MQRNVNNSAINIYITAPFDVSLNFSTSSDYRKMKHSSLVSSHHDESNGGDFILLSEMEAEIFNENCIEKFTNLIHIESDYIRIRIRSDYIRIRIRSDLGFGSDQFELNSDSDQFGSDFLEFELDRI